MDRILIKDLRARCIIGVNEDERREKQDVTVNLELAADLSQAVRSDRFEDTVDYRSIKKEILKMVEASSYNLLESLTEAIARLCLNHEKIRRVKVRVEKPAALRFARSVAIEMVRRKES